MKATTPYLGIAVVVAGGLSLISAQALLGQLSACVAANTF